MFRAVTVRKSSFPRGSPAFHPSSGGATPHTRRPSTLKNRSWNFSDLEFFSNFFFSDSLSFSSAFIHSSPGDHVTTTSSGLGNIFQFFRLFSFFNFLTLSRFARRIDFISIDIKSHLSAKAQQLFDIFRKFAIFFHFQLIFYIPVCRSLSLSFSRDFIYFRPPLFFFKLSFSLG